MKNNRYLTTLIVYTTAIVLLVLVQILASLGYFNGLSEQMLEVVGSLLPQLVVMAGIPCLMLLVAQKVNREPVSIQQVCRDTGWGRMPLKNVALCFVLGICLYILNIFIASIFASLLRSFGYQFSSSDNAFTGYSGLLISLVLTAVLPGICEEFLHRGVLLNGLVKQLGVRKALLWSSILFGLMHMNVGQFFYATILGWFMGVVALSSGSLWGSIIVHFTNNAIATYFSFAEELNLPGMNLVSYLFSNVLVLGLTLLVVVVVIGEIIRLMARDKFKRNLDRYTVRYLATQSQFGVEDFDRLKVALTRALQTLPTWKATAAYIETFDEPQKSRPLERALFTFVFVIGAVITLLSFVWGTW